MRWCPWVPRPGVYIITPSPAQARPDAATYCFLKNRFKLRGGFCTACSSRMSSVRVGEFWCICRVTRVATGTHAFKRPSLFCPLLSWPFSPRPQAAPDLLSFLFALLDIPLPGACPGVGEFQVLGVPGVGVPGVGGSRCWGSRVLGVPGVGVPGVDFVPLANDPACLRLSFLAHTGYAALILVCEAWSGRVASKGRPGPKKPPPSPQPHPEAHPW